MTTSPADFLPGSQRVLYRRNPLVEVICQVRFPTILKIESELPSDFQETIRKQFPFFERSANALEGKVPPEILKAIGASPRTSYQFVSEDRRGNITLSGTTLSIATSRYERWEDFLVSIELAIKNFVAVYEPAFYARVGLRYQNVIQRSSIGIDAEWSDLLRPEIAGEFLVPNWGKRIQEANKMVLCDINDLFDSMRFHHGLAQVEGSEEDCYLLDFDYFNDEKTGTTDVFTVIDRLHSHSGKAFRWAISETLHNALEPSKG